MIWLGLLPEHVLLEATGRPPASGAASWSAPTATATSYGWWLLVVAEQGTHAGYVRNLQTDPRVRVRLGQHWTKRWLDTFGMPVHARNVRRFGTDLRTI
jgi:F420H(2)-dependent quinone reductase